MWMWTISRVVGVLAIGMISTACGSLTPEQEAAAFFESLSECLTNNRDALVQGMDNVETDDGAEAFEELCDMDRGGLSEEAVAIVEESGTEAFAGVMPMLLGAAFASVFSDGAVAEETMRETILNALADAFYRAAEDLNGQ